MINSFLQLHSLSIYLFTQVSPQTLKKKQEKQESKLFYELGQNVFQHFFRKTTTKKQILDEGKATIEALKVEGDELEKKKAKLVASRARLFERLLFIVWQV